MFGGIFLPAVKEGAIYGSFFMGNQVAITDDLTIKKGTHYEYIGKTVGGHLCALRKPLAVMAVAVPAETC
ncbi:hypothetical protein QU24_24500 [Pantoea rodasii]|uniref:Uncharacterized protein n=2 Tax=Pantoea TaxID=53335 RepID=A0A0U3K0M4_9GAMM|nr:hypothetical protein LK04_12780 [Pantoea vagans]KHJ65428.1 hypothetical protein QU24_24500 [Pantoea rodasii]